MRRRDRERADGAAAVGMGIRPVRERARERVGGALPRRVTLGHHERVAVTARVAERAELAVLAAYHEHGDASGYQRGEHPGLAEVGVQSGDDDSRVG
jgi:hypothetical protein